MKKLLPMLLLAVIVAGCDSHNLSEQDKNQPLYPTMWSPVGKVYIYEETWEKSSAEDKYWVWVLDFFTEDSVLWYETDLRSLEYNGSNAYARETYKLKYPNLTLYTPSMDPRRLFFIDTTTIDAPGWGIVYTILTK